MKKIERIWIERGTPAQVRSVFALICFLNKLKITNIREVIDVRLGDMGAT